MMDYIGIENAYVNNTVIIIINVLGNTLGNILGKKTINQ